MTCALVLDINNIRFVERLVIHYWHVSQMYQIGTVRSTSGEHTTPYHTPSSLLTHIAYLPSYFVS